MAATVKTLLQNHGELYWGSRQNDPGYQFGLSLDVDEVGITAQVVYVMSDYDDNDEELVTPELLMSCYTADDLERVGIVPSDRMGHDEPGGRGWYCIERSLFPKDQVNALTESNERLGGYLDIILQIMLITPEEVEAGLPTIDEISFYDLLEELEGVSDLIDKGDLSKPLPFEFHLINDALFGWQFANEADFR